MGSETTCKRNTSKGTRWAPKSSSQRSTRCDSCAPKSAGLLSALCGILVLSDRVVMALRRGEGMVHPLTAPGAKWSCPRPCALAMFAARARNSRVSAARPASRSTCHVAGRESPTPWISCRPLPRVGPRCFRTCSTVKSPCLVAGPSQRRESPPGFNPCAQGRGKACRQKMEAVRE